MDILILGNGFDLAHELPTKYTDFLDYCIKKYENKDIGYYSQSDIEQNIWLQHFIFQRQNNKSMGKNWIDLEEEIYNVLMHIRALPLITKSGITTDFCPQIFFLKKDCVNFNFYDIKNNLTEPSVYNKNDRYNYKKLLEIKEPKDLIYFLYQQLRDFTVLFEKYLIKEVFENNIKSFILPKDRFTSSIINRQIYALNFNYTDTIERLYFSNPQNNLKIFTVYIHGKADNTENCNIILGTKNFDRIYHTNFGIEQIMPVEFNVFKKYFQRHKYNTIEEYQKFLKRVKETQEPVFHIIGHSLDSSDHEILKHVLMKNPNSIINIYYHDEEAQERLMNKIDLIIGEEEVMSKVRFIRQDDPQRGILIPKEELKVFTT